MIPIQATLEAVMKILAKFLMVLLITVGVSFAGSVNNEVGVSTFKPVVFSCTETNDGIIPYNYECFIRQTIPDSVPVFVSDGWTSSETWSQFVENLDNALLSSVGNADKVDIYLKSDINLGGYSVLNGDTACAMDDFTPLSFAGVGKSVEFHGNGYGINGFCYIKEDEQSGQVSFFDGYYIRLIEKLKFDGAYVKLSGKGSAEMPLLASIVVASADNITLTQVQVEKSSLNISAPSGTNLVSVGGLVGYAVRVNEIEVTYSVADVEIVVEGEPNALFAGKLVGYVEGSSDAEKGGTFVVEGNISKGDLIVPDGYASMEKVYLGYVAGGLAYAPTVQIRSNYHLGKGDVDIKSALGVLKNSQGVDVTDWPAGNLNDYDVRYNYRNTAKNGSKSLKADGSLSKDGSGEIAVGEETWKNGVLSDSLMKTRLFTYILNEGMSGSTYWEDDGSYPYLSDTRTAYKLEFYVSSEIYSKLSIADKKSIDSYLTVKTYQGANNPSSQQFYIIDAFSGKDYSLDGNFVKTMNALSVKLAVLMLEVSVASNLEKMKLYGDEYAGAVLDKKLAVVYEIPDPAVVTGESLILMDDYSVDFLYSWKRPESVYFYSAREAVPLVFGENNQTQTVLQAYVNCKPGYEDECNKASYSNQEGGAFWNFGQLLDEVRYMMDGPEEMYTDTLHLVYGSVQSVNAPLVYVGSEESRSRTYVVPYGYKNGKLAFKDSIYAGGPDNAGMYNNSKVAMSKFAAFTETGFVLKNWTVDLWLGGQNSRDRIEDCMFNGLCDNVISASSKTNYLESTSNLDKMFESVSEGADMPPLHHVTVTLGAEELLDMDSLVQAMSYYGGYNAPDYTLFMQVTPELIAVSYKVTFDVNAGDDNVFLGEKLTYMDTYSRDNEYSSTLPGVYSTKACFKGWGEKLKDPEYKYSALDGYLFETMDIADNAFSLYGRWLKVGEDTKECMEIYTNDLKLTTVNIEGEEGSYGTVSLWQSYAKLGKDMVKYTHEFESGVMQVPQADEQMNFHVASKPAKGYKLSKLELLTMSADGYSQVNSAYFGIADTSFSLYPQRGVDAELKAYFGRYVNVATNLNGDHGEVFYGVDSRMDSIMVLEGGQALFPSTVYTAEACVWGWAFDSKAKWDDAEGVYHVMSSDQNLYDLAEKSKAFYAVWMNGDECVDNARYGRVKLTAEHGAVQFVETQDNADTSYVHSFAKDNTMLLPHEMFGAVWTVRTLPEEGYKLDSLVLTTRNLIDNEQQQEEWVESRFVLQDGDTLLGHMQNATMRAYFSEIPEDVEDSSALQLVRHELLQSGNAVQLTLETNQFEVDGSASLQVSLTDALGVVLENTGFVEEVKVSPYERVWTKYPLLPGKYVLKATLSDKAEKVSFDTAFTVSAEIAAAPDAWRMVSLSDVEIDSIVWDADPVFYHWDEAAYFGDFWKYRKYRGDKVVAEQGFWYSSLEGRPLLLRRDSARTGNEIVWKLDSGWNMVANPYGWGVQLNAEQLEKDSLVLTVWNPESADYPGKTLYLGPYEAAWVYSESKRTAEVGQEPFFVSAAEHTPGFGYPLEKRVLAKAESRSNWTLQAVLSDTKGHRDSWNVIGAGAAAEQPEPPEGMGDHVNLSLLEGKRALAKSIRSADERYEWKMALSATGDRAGYLRFEGVKALNEMGLKVFVTVDGKTTEVVAGDSLKVMLKAAGATATVRVAPMDARALASKVENLRFEYVPGALQVGFDVSEGLAGANYMVQLVGVSGKVAASARGKSVAGRNALALTAPKPGLYLLRVTVAGNRAIRKVAVSR